VLVPLEDSEWTLQLLGALESIEAGRLRGALDTLQEALELDGRLVRVPDRLPTDLPALRKALEAEFAADVPANAVQSRRFVPVAWLAHWLLARVPPGAVSLYRKLHEVEAEKLLAQHAETGDLKPLEAVVKKYFLCRRGPEALERLAAFRLEAGLFRRALELWRRARDLPLVDPEAARRMSLHCLYTLRLLGERRQYEFERSRLVEATSSPEFRAVLEDELRRLEVAVPWSDLRGGFVEACREVSRGRWGGEPDRTPLPVLPAASYKLSWRSPYWTKGLGGPAHTQGRHPVRGRGRALGRRPESQFVALAEGNDIYLSGLDSLFQLQGGRARGSIQRQMKKPLPPHLSKPLPAYKELGASAGFTTTVLRSPSAPALRPLDGFGALPDKVFVTNYVSDRVDASEFLSYPITVELPIRSLVAFSGESGDVLWKTGRNVPSILRAFRDRDGLTPKKELSYTSAVVVKDGLVVAGGWVQRGYIDTLLRAHDLRTGKVVWELFLSGAQLEQTLFGEMAREPFACAITERDSVVYFCSQFGVIAAADLHTGTVLWETTYDTIAVDAAAGQGAMPRETVWGMNPMLLLGHVLIVTPRDSELLYAIDTGSGPEGQKSAGRVLWTYDNAGGIVRDLLGSDGDSLFFTGRRNLGRLDLRQLPGFETHAGAGKGGPRLAKRLSGRQPMGAGALTAQGIVFPTRWGLYLFEPDPSSPALEGKLTTLLRARLEPPGRLQVIDGLLLRTVTHTLPEKGEGDSGLYCYEPIGALPAR